MSVPIGKVIRKYRTENKISAKAFAESCGLSRAYIAMLEANHRFDNGKAPTPSLDAIIRIAKAMDMDTYVLMKKIGMDIQEKTGESDATAVKPSVLSGTAQKIRPFEYVPLTQENLNAAVKERRLILLPFRAPRRGDLVWIPMPECGMAVAHTITMVGGGVYEAYSEINGTVSFSLFDIGHSVFQNRTDAEQEKDKWTAIKP